MIFSTRLLNLYRACADEGVRYAMQCVLFERDEQFRCRAVATNSKALMIVEWDEDKDAAAVAEKLGIKEPVPFRALIPGDALRLAAFVVKKARYDKPYVGIGEADGKTRLALFARDSVVALEQATIDGRFPAYKEIVRKVTMPTEPTAAFSPALLGEWATIAADVLDSQNCTSLIEMGWAAGGSSAIGRFDAKQPDGMTLTGVVMGLDRAK